MGFWRGRWVFWVGGGREQQQHRGASFFFFNAGDETKALTKMPSNLAATNVKPGSETASANSCPSTSSPPQWSESLLMYPLKEPVPYWMANFVPFFWWVAEDEAEYWLCRRQAMLKSAHCDEGTHRLEDPVSKMTPKGWGGVPRAMAP